MRGGVFYAHGGREVIQIADDLPEPSAPAAGEARVRIAAVALNRLDLWVRTGWRGLDLAMPHITCADGAGIVEAVGDGVTMIAPGDRVSINPTILDTDCLLRTGDESACLDSPILGEHVPGTAADIRNLPARNLLKIPDDVAFDDAAAAGLVYVTAWRMLLTRGGLRPGETVAIIGAGGGVNTAALQIAKLCGCQTIVVGSDATKCANAAALGADITIDRSADPAWAKAIHKLTDRQGVDLVVDNVGKATLGDSMKAVRRGGRIVIVGNTSGYDAQIDTRYLFGKQISLIGSTMGTTQDYQTVMGLVFAGKLRPVIGARLPLADLQEGHRLLEEGSIFGKIVLTL